MRVINFTLYRDNPYQQLLYSALQPQYEPVRGNVDDALAALSAGDSGLCHVHWEEHSLRRCGTAVEAQLISDTIVSRLELFRQKGGKVVWTLHNEMPHELEHPAIFVRFRRKLAALADRILVHSLHAISVLRQQVELDGSKVFYLPHPSYLGVYEPEVRSLQSRPKPTERVAMTFGKIRRYKGLEFLLEAIKLDPLPGVRFRIVGEPLPGEPLAQRLAAEYGQVSHIELDFRRVADAEVPDLLRSASCLVLPYERFLTSGVALLGLTFGVPLVAPDAPQLRELLPAPCHPLLFQPGNHEDLRRALRQAVELGEAEFSEIVRSSLAVAEQHRPSNASALLGRVFDALRAAA